LGFTKDSHFLILDQNNTQPLPKNFRTSEQLLTHGNQITTTGLASLHILGSGEFTEKQLKTVKNLIPHPIIIVDLRQEPHGFINGLPIYWHGYQNTSNKTHETIEQEQQSLLNALKNRSVISTYLIKKNQKKELTKFVPFSIQGGEVLSEKELADRLHLGYVRFYLTEHSMPPSQELEKSVRHYL
jgi:hypothetical protein